LISIVHTYTYDIYTPSTRALALSIVKLLENLSGAENIHLSNDAKRNIKKISEIATNLKRRDSKGLLIANQTITRLLWERKITFIYPGDDTKENDEAIANVMQFMSEIRKIKKVYSSASKKFDSTKNGQELSKLLKKLKNNGVYLNLDWVNPEKIIKEFRKLKQKDVLIKMSILVKRKILTMQESKNFFKLLTKKMHYVFENQEAQALAEKMRKHNWKKVIDESAMADRNTVLAQRAAAFHRTFKKERFIVAVYGSAHGPSLHKAVKEQNKKGAGKLGLIVFYKN